MRILFAALAAHGHTFPSIPLAIAARDAGHDVVFAAGEQFTTVLRDAGLTAETAGMSMREAFAGIGASRRDVGRVIGDVLPRSWVRDLVPLIERHRPDLVVHDLATLGAGLAARVTGTPAAAHGFGRVSPDEMSDEMMLSFSALAAELGVPADGGGPVFDICPRSLQSPEFLAGQGRIPLRPVGWSGRSSAGVPDGRPLVYLTLGTAFATADLLGQAVSALAALPVTVLAATGPAVDTDALGAVPSTVHLAQWVDQPAALAAADLVVHHGGSGTMLGAFAAGVPQLLLPRGADQFSNAEAVTGAGAGERLLPGEVSGEAITAKAAALLADDSARAAVRSLADEIAAMPSPAEVAALLPELAR